MHGVVTLLHGRAGERVQAIWDELGSRVLSVPFPHLSWSVAEGYHVDELESALGEVAQRVGRLTVRAAGLGVFSGDAPVVYVPIVRTAALSWLHNIVFEAVTPLAVRPDVRYSPDEWVPHVTLARDDLWPSDVGGLVARLASRTIDWTLAIDNLTLLWHPPDEPARIGFKVLL